MANEKLFLQDLEKRFGDGQWPPASTVKSLLKLCAHPEQEVRETALSLLLHPPTSDEAAHYRWLLGLLAGWKAPPRRLPAPLLERLLEVPLSLGGIQPIGEHSHYLVHLLRHLPRSFAAELIGKSWPVQPLINELRLDSLSPPGRPPSSDCRRRWRLLRKRLGQIGPHPAWAEVTLRDLGVLFHPKPGGKKPRLPGPAHWLACGRRLLLQPSHRTLHMTPLPFRSAFWDGLGNRSGIYLDGLLRQQGEEMRSVRGLAREVSARTRRVVLSLHNATLAAVSGWAFEDLCTGFPSRSLWKSFAARVRQNVARRTASPSTFRSSRELRALWSERVMLPKIQWCLWENFNRSAKSSEARPATGKWARRAARLMDVPVDHFSVESKGWGRPALVGTHQRLKLPEILTGLRVRLRSWDTGWALLLAVLEEGQVLLGKGDLECLVIPWIDKFFISSRRDQDLAYLPTVLHHLRKHRVSPLVLFWEDTHHGRDPSFKLALQRLRTLGYRYRGIGVFDEDVSSRREALGMILAGSGQTDLFALRPVSDRHNPRPLQSLLRNLDFGFFREYDSSWKDDLCFIYSGTQVSSMLSVPSDREDFSGWVVFNRNKLPFGAFFRQALRYLTVGEARPTNEPLSRRLALWANLR